MKIPVFTLTKREQRVMVVITFLLLVGALARHYHDANSQVNPAPTSHAVASPSPGADDESPPDDGGND